MNLLQEQLALTSLEEFLITSYKILGENRNIIFKQLKNNKNFKKKIRYIIKTRKKSELKSILFSILLMVFEYKYMVNNGKSEEINRTKNQKINRGLS